MKNTHSTSKNTNLYINNQSEEINQNETKNHSQNIRKKHTIPSVKKRKKKELSNTAKKTKKSDLIKNDPHLHQTKTRRFYESSSPRYLKVFERIDILNSCLITISNISLSFDYFNKVSALDCIENCIKNEQCSLCFILFLIHKNLWKYNKNSEKNLLELYNCFAKKYSQDNSSSLTDYEDYFINPDNKSTIIKFIYEKLNSELTKISKENQSNNNNNGCCNNMNNNNNNFINYYDKNSVLSSYLELFKQYYYSFISDNFIGFFEKEMSCEICRQNSNLYHTYSFEIYFDFDFNLETISNFYSNNNKNLTLENCFNYYFVNQKNQIENTSNCFICGTNSPKYIIKTILSLPNIITITINKYEKKLYSLFRYPDELDLTNYTSNNLPDNIFYLISVICEDVESKEIFCYCINKRDKSWYLYTNDNISQCDEINENHIPLVLFYQKKNMLNFEYKKINKNYKINLRLVFKDGKERKMKVNQNLSVKDVIKMISKETNQEFTINDLVLDGQYLDKNFSISNYNIDEYSVILVE